MKCAGRITKSQSNSLLAIGVIHFGAVAAFLPPFLNVQNLAALLILHFCCGGLGVSLGLHRYFSHRSFQTTWLIEYLLAVLATLSWQGGPMWWVTTHHRHHRAADTEKDPHSPRHGFFWAHFQWFLSATEAFSIDEYRQSVPYMANKPFLVFVEKHPVLIQAALATILMLVGGLGMVLWGICLRLTITYHSTWLVNSACHTWGYRTFNSSDKARNLWWVAVITYGEGWHNNHHSCPISAKIGFKWWELDPIWWLIKLMELSRLVWNVRGRSP